MGFMGRWDILLPLLVFLVIGVLIARFVLRGLIRFIRREWMRP